MIPLDLGGFFNGEHINNRWAFDCNKVQKTFTTGGNLVVFRWAFDGIKVGNTLTTGGPLVAFRWGIHGTYFRKWATSVGPCQSTTWPQLPPMSKNQHGPGWANPVRPNVAAQLGPSYGQCGMLAGQGPG